VRFGVVFALIGIIIFSVATVADMPPPLDEYTGPTSADLAAFVKDGHGGNFSTQHFVMSVVAL